MNTGVPQNTSSVSESQTRFAFILITSLFFLWGFAHNLDPILIPHLKKSFTLTTTQSTLVDSAVFDSAGDIRWGYIVPLVSFVIICFFGLKGFKVINKVEKQRS